LRARNDEKKAERSQARNMVDRDGWPKRVLAQAGWQCDACGSTENLHAHHILPFAKYPQFRCLDDNGAALCKSCHVDVHRLINAGVTAGDALVEVLLRAGRKEGTDDVGKAEHYRQFLTEWDATNGK
jgi:5-methylcytosine-specific restriction endonuclease McrA